MNVKDYAIFLYMTSSEFYTQRLVFNTTTFHFNINLKDTIYYELYGILSVECEMELTDGAISYSEISLCEYFLKGKTNLIIINDFIIYTDLFYLTNENWQLNEKTNIISDEKYISFSCNSLLSFQVNVSLDIYTISIDISKYKFESVRYDLYNVNELDCISKIGNKQDIDLIIYMNINFTQDDIQKFYNLDGFRSICFQCVSFKNIDILYNSLFSVEKVNSNYNVIALNKFIFDTEIDGEKRSIIGKSNSKILEFLLKYFDDIQLY